MASQGQKEALYRMTSEQAAQIMYVQAMPFQLKPLVIAMRTLICEERGHEIRLIGKTSQHIVGTCARCQMPVIERR